MLSHTVGEHRATTKDTRERAHEDPVWGETRGGLPEDDLQVLGEVGADGADEEEAIQSTYQQQHLPIM